MSISDDDFVLKGILFVISASLHKHVLADLHTSHRGIGGTKAGAGLMVYWPEIDNDITNTCKSCSKCEHDLPSNVKEPMQHLLVAIHAFQIISADWFWKWFDVKGRVLNSNAASLISCLREWFINTHVCDLLRSDGDPPFGSTEVSNFLAHWGVEWCPSLPHYSQGNSIAESAVK